MKITSNPSLLLGLGLALLATQASLADQGKGNGNGNGNANGNDTTYVLEDGTVHETPGAMFQYLRTRDNDLAAGNPKDIVNAYPDDFETVGDLIHQKRETAE
jgi:hypothetical protein